MIALFFLVVCMLLVLFLISRGKYDEFLEPLDSKEYAMKKLMPMALYLLELFNYSYSGRYDRNLAGKTAELYSIKYSQYYLRIHWANKISSILAALLVLPLIGIGAGADAGFGVFSLAVLFALFYLPDSELDKKVKKRRMEIQLDFPDFINKLTLLVNAGMTISKAWEKIVQDNKRDRPLYKEMQTALAEIKAGKPEIKSYEDFAKRCRIPQVTKFVSVVIQNIKKGNSELVPILRLQAGECWEMRKTVAKRLGEEASTKMLLPMMIMFVAILIIVAVPAILAMQGI